MRLLILGATGGTGAHLTEQALERGHFVTAFVRSPGRLKMRHERLRVAEGDARDPERLSGALNEQDAVLSALGATGRDGDGILESAARSTVEAMHRAGVRRLVAISMALLFPNVGPLGPVLRFLLRHHLRDSAAMESAVEASDLEWTLVRPPRLTNGRVRGRYRVSEGRAPPSLWISRADLAHAILDFTESPAHVRQVIGVSA